MVTIDGLPYEAIYVGTDTWIIKRFNKDGTCVEAELNSPAGTMWQPREAIKAAIARGSWA